MLKKTMFVASVAASLMMMGGTAFAADNDGYESDDTVGLVNTGDILSDNAINVCHNYVNVLGVQVVDVLNGLSASVPILTSETDSDSEGTYQEPCVAAVASEDDH